MGLGRTTWLLGRQTHLDKDGISVALYPGHCSARRLITCLDGIGNLSLYTLKEVFCGRPSSSGKQRLGEDRGGGAGAGAGEKYSMLWIQHTHVYVFIYDI